MVTDQTPAQRMAEIQEHLEVVTDPTLQWLFNRCRKLEKVAEAATPILEDDFRFQRHREAALRALRKAYKEAGYDL